MVKTRKRGSDDFQSHPVDISEIKKERSMLDAFLSIFSISRIIGIRDLFMRYATKELSLRVVSGLFLGIFVLFFTLHSSVAFGVMVLFLTVILVFEWVQMISNASEYRVDDKFTKKWKIIGVLYTFIPSACAIIIRDMNNGATIMMWCFLTVWATDTVAYFVGSRLGKRKLCPTISPKKTYEGLVGGIVGGLIVSMMIYFISFLGGTHRISVHGFFLLTLGVTLLSQVGDLLESALKRRFGIKDSGMIIPGHGGAMDRFDAMVLVLPFLLMVILFSNSRLF